MMLAAALAAFLATASTPPAHVDEIEAFALVAASAQAASNECPDLLLNKPFLDAIARKVIVSEEDGKVYTDRATADMASLMGRLKAAPGRAAWCDDLYALFGPAGTVLPKVLARSSEVR